MSNAFLIAFLIEKKKYLEWLVRRGCLEHHGEIMIKKEIQELEAQIISETRVRHEI
jgi:hypothetical protein